MIQFLKVITFCLFTLFVFNGQAQDVDSTKIKDLEIQILQAVDDNNFELVKKLNQEKNIRIKAEEAIKKGDLELADKLKKQAEIIASQRKEWEIEQESSNNVVFTYDRDFEKIIKSGFSLEVLTGFISISTKETNYYTYGKEYPFEYTKTSFSNKILPRFGLKPTAKIYFTRPNKFRFGAELGGNLLLGGVANLKLVQFGPLIGPTLIYTKNKKTAITGSLLLGPSICDMSSEYYVVDNDLGAGIVIIPSFRFGVKKFFVGIDLSIGNYDTANYNKFSYSYFLIAAGFKF